MSVRKEVYIIFGVKLSEQLTREYWEKPFSNDTEWNKNKPNGKPFFISDGMNGLYTFFGYVQQINDGSYDFEEHITELNFNYDKSTIIDEIARFFPELTVNECDVKFYYLPHFV